MRSLFKSSLPHFQVISTILHMQDAQMVEFYWEGLIVREKVMYDNFKYIISPLPSRISFL